MNHSCVNRPLDLVVNGNDISEHVSDWATCDESREEWTVHTELNGNETTSSTFEPLNGKTVRVEYRIRGQTVKGPWRRGRAEVAWRITETGNEELILHGMGRLAKENSHVSAASNPISASLTMTTSVEGKAIAKEEGIGTLSFVKEKPLQKENREAQFQRVKDAEIQSLTSPEFILFLANSALSSYRSLYSTGMAQNNNELLYSSFIFLPLSIEYFIKYLLAEDSGEPRIEYKTHKLLTLFDHLPFDVQKSVDREFKNELENIGRQRQDQELRILLMKSRNAFTALRYLFNPEYATTSRHLLRPENIALLTCVCNALERVTGHR